VLRAVRLSLVVQALCMIVLLGTVLPGFLGYVTRPPLECPPGDSCFDPSGAGFVIYALVFVPMGAVLVLTAWLWQTDKRWPAVVPIAIDLLLLGGGISDLLSSRQPVEYYPPPAAELVLLVIPALLSLGLVVTFVGLSLLRRMDEQTGPNAGAQTW
jgi:hypothetical protein